MEIERKFLVSSPPADLSRRPATSIVQGYIAVDADGTEVRLRRRGEDSVLTIKQGAGRTRVEEEIEIDAERFDRSWPLTEGRRVEKTRYVIPAGEHCIELDVYSGALSGLVIAEVEFPDERAADAFQPPEWFGREVTDDPRFKNQRLARDGMPALASDPSESSD
jgi:CYTH domain-containing protein